MTNDTHIDPYTDDELHSGCGGIVLATMIGVAMWAVIAVAFWAVFLR